MTYQVTVLLTFEQLTPSRLEQTGYCINPFPVSTSPNFQQYALLLVKFSTEGEKTHTSIVLQLGTAVKSSGSLHVLRHTHNSDAFPN